LKIPIRVGIPAKSPMAEWNAANEPVVHRPDRDNSLAYRNEDCVFDAGVSFLTFVWWRGPRQPMADEPKLLVGRLKGMPCNFSWQSRVVI
jgi:hypothetical protein